MDRTNTPLRKSAAAQALVNDLRKAEDAAGKIKLTNEEAALVVQEAVENEIRQALSGLACAKGEARRVGPGRGDAPGPGEECYWGSDEYVTEDVAALRDLVAKRVYLDALMRRSFSPEILLAIRQLAGKEEGKAATKIAALVADRWPVVEARVAKAKAAAGTAGNGASGALKAVAAF